MVRILPAGDAALLVELSDLAHTLALYRKVEAQPVAGVTELVPAARTLLVHFDRGATDAPTLAARLREHAAQAQQHAADQAPARTVEIPVHYNGEDLPELAQWMGISVRELIARHCGQPWQAAFAGFAPGFVYLSDGHASFAQIPRRTTPRTRLPAGSVALAGDFSAVYPAASPGGWQLIGVTEVAMWDMARAEPAYVQPGFRVQFIDADAPGMHISLPAAVGRPSPQHSAQRGEGAGPVLPPLPPGEGRGEGAPASAEKFESNTSPAHATSAQAAITIESPGLQTLVQDAGRHGLAGLGVSSAGALDQAALRQANRLVGNPIDTPVLENLLGGLVLRCHGRATLAVTGAPVPLKLLAGDGRSWSVASHSGIALNEGDRLHFGAPGSGMRCYVAARGGFEITPVLGSCSSDTLALIGPAPLKTGDSLAIRQTPALRAVAPPDMPPTGLPSPGDEVLLDVLLGPRADWFTPEAIALLQSQDWRVTPQSNRIGVRLAGEQPLTRSRHDELPSEGTVAGALQIPASGQPVLFLADHPLTGGYPVVAVLASHHLNLAAQIPVGCSVRFRVVAPFKEA